MSERDQPPAPGGHDRAEARLWLLTLVRLLGIGIVLGGMWIAGRAPGDPKLLAAGLAVMAAGGLVSLLLPGAVARRWRE